MIRGVNHILLSVSDLDRSFGFYCDVLGLTPVARSANGAYLSAGSLWLCLEQDGRVRNGPLGEYTHLAFDVAAGDLETMAARIRRSGAVIWKENTSEGASLYFLDPDGHKLELHVGDLSSRLAHYRAHPEKGVAVMVPPGGCNGTDRAEGAS